MECFSTKCNFNPRKPVRCDTIPRETWKKYILTPDRELILDKSMDTIGEVQFGEQTHFIGAWARGYSRSRKESKTATSPKAPHPPTQVAVTISGNLGHTLHSLQVDQQLEGVLCWYSLCWASCELLLLVLVYSRHFVWTLSILVCKDCQVFFPTPSVWEWLAAVFSVYIVLGEGEA